MPTRDLAGALATALSAALSAALLAACAADARVVAWVARWEAAERAVDDAPLSDGLAALYALEATAPTPVDRTMIQLRRARVLAERGRDADAWATLDRVGDTGVRRADRSRARLEQARLAARRGQHGAARRLYRRIVLTWPEEMPGLRALAALQREALAGDTATARAHLAWSFEAYPRLRDTSLGDNLLWFAARAARDRWRATGEARWAEVAEALYRRLDRDHPRAGMWDEGVWELSFLYHDLGRHADELQVIRRFVATRETAVFMGSYEQPEYWLGALRVARHRLLDLGDPAAAARDYARVAATWPGGRWRDDALFWEGCAWLRAGRPARAEAAFARIPEAYADSKYLRRLDAARADPRGSVCVPAVVWEAP